MTVPAQTRPRPRPRPFTLQFARRRLGVVYAFTRCTLFFIFPSCPSSQPCGLHYPTSPPTLRAGLDTTSLPSSPPSTIPRLLYRQSSYPGDEQPTVPSRLAATLTQYSLLTPPTIISTALPHSGHHRPSFDSVSIGDPILTTTRFWCRLDLSLSCCHCQRPSLASLTRHWSS